MNIHGRIKTVIDSYFGMNKCRENFIDMIIREFGEKISDERILLEWAIRHCRDNEKEFIRKKSILTVLA